MPTNPQYSERATRFKVTFERRDPTTSRWQRGFARTKRFTAQEAIEAVQLNHQNANERNGTSIEYRNYNAEPER
jgi:hypothetical protein